jgi:segregation and condensation protein B
MNIKPILEAALFALGHPLSIERMQALFEPHEKPSKEEIQLALESLQTDYQDHGIELKELATGFCFQTCEQINPWLKNLWQEKPQKYSRAFLETLALIAYRQPITRGEIEAIRGVSVSSNIIKTLMEKSWIRVVGQRDLPGKPELFATTPEFLDYFNMRSLEELPAFKEST